MKNNSSQQPKLIVEEVASYTFNKETGRKLEQFSKDDLIEKLLDIKSRGWIRNARPGNAGGVGNTLEDLLGIQENNLPIPNAAEWELKCQRRLTSSLVTLFHMEPSPRAFRFVPNILLPKYGWPHKNAGSLYQPSERSFRQTISGVQFSDRGFKIDVRRDLHKVVVTFDHQVIAEKHKVWKAQVEQTIGLSELDPQPYWGFDDLAHKAGTKLPNVFFVQANSTRLNDVEHFHYDKFFVLKGFRFEGLLDGIEQGYVFVDFDARTGHNHGTKFRFKLDRLPTLYSEVQEF